MISDDELSTIMSNASKASNSSPSISKEKIFEKVKKAANKIGIENELMIKMWNRNDMRSYATDGVIREFRFASLRDKDNDWLKREFDLGYLRKDIDGRFTKNSFYVNRWAFTELKLEEFFSALRSYGMATMVFRPLGIVFPTSEDIEKENRRIAETEISATYR